MHVKMNMHAINNPMTITWQSPSLVETLKCALFPDEKNPPKLCYELYSGQRRPDGRCVTKKSYIATFTGKTLEN
jgi:hypothetical protein